MKYAIICNKEQREYLCAGSKDFYVFDQSAALDQNWPLWKTLKGFVILVETHGSHPYFLSLKGLDVLREIRIKLRLDLPVLLISWVLDLNFAWENRLIEKKQAPFNVLLDPSVKVIPVRFFIEQVRQGRLHKLFPKPINDDILFEDVQNLYGPKSYLNELSHALRKRINAFAEIASGADILHFVQDIFKEISWIIPAQQHKIGQVYEHWEAEIQVNQFYHFARDWAKKLRDDLDSINNEVGLTYEEPFPLRDITVLSIDDDPVDQDILAEKLRKYRIDCLRASNLDEARKQLQEHPEVGVAIIDYRFYDQYGRFNAVQCHNFIDVLSEFKNGPLSFIILTNYPESLSTLFQKRYAGLRRFSKRILQIDLAFIHFIQVIVEEVNDQERKLGETLGLNKNFYNYYRAYCADKSYNSNEEKINRIADDYLAKVTKGAFDQLPELPVQTNLKATSNFFDLEMFGTKLVGRRVILGMLQLETFWEETKKKGKKPKWSTILNVVCKRKLTAKKDEEMEQNQENQIINANLSLKKKHSYTIHTSIEDMKILEEEKAWLKHFRNTIKYE